jgi:hypothetical protein
MITVKFYVKKETFEFTAESVGKAMAMGTQTSRSAGDLNLLYGSNMPMIQQQIKFFWPLTEQIQLDLIYEDCKPLPLSGTLLISNGGTTSLWTGGVTNTVINCDQIRFQTKKKHTFLQRLMYKAMGIKVIFVK